MGNRPRAIRFPLRGFIHTLSLALSLYGEGIRAHRLDPNCGFTPPQKTRNPKRATRNCF